LSFLAHTGFYLFFRGKPYGEKPPSSAGYDCVRAFTGFCVNPQRMSVSEAPAETGGGDLLPVGRLRLPLPRGALRASSGSPGFLRPGTVSLDVSGVRGSVVLYALLSVVSIRSYTLLYSPGLF
jgi:hypothetical protein